MLLAGLRDRRPVAAPVALVVAHPDDETLAAGGSLHLLPDLLLVHVTDGAPRDAADAVRAGFAGWQDYAAARADELRDALRLAPAAPRRVELGIADQEASADLAGLAARLRALFAAHRIASVLTHAYEGGHPDHDATAWAVHQAAGTAEIVEFAGYHAGAGAMRTGQFLPAAPELAELAVVLAPPELARKRAMLACFHSQDGMLAQFDPATERFRPAPRYRFTDPPHEGALNYERWGWKITGAEWRRRAAAAREAACVG